MLLDRAGEIETDPFPHVVIENALPDDYYAELVRTRPTPQQIMQWTGKIPGPNQRLDLPTKTALLTLSKVWVEFCKSHTSPEFVRRAMALLGAKDVPVTRVECQPGINTPSPTPTKVRGPHLDNPVEIYAGLFYMAEDQDGGNLEIYRWKDGEKKFHGKLEVEESCVDLVKTVPYKPNTFVLFLNGPDALHGVTPRKSRNFRNLVNVIAETNSPLFKVGYGRY
jgi:hypothetical protein